MYGVSRCLIGHPICCTDVSGFSGPGRTQQHCSDGLDWYRCFERVAARRAIDARDRYKLRNMEVL